MSTTRIDQPQPRTIAQPAPNSADLAREDEAFLAKFPRQLAEFIDPSSCPKLYFLLANRSTRLSPAAYELLMEQYNYLTLVLHEVSMSELTELLMEWLDCYLNNGGVVPCALGDDDGE